MASGANVNLMGRSRLQEDDHRQGQPPLPGLQREGRGVHEEFRADFQQRSKINSFFKQSFSILTENASVKYTNILFNCAINAVIVVATTWLTSNML